jgi:penicillin-binding protein 1A
MKRPSEIDPPPSSTAPGANESPATGGGDFKRRAARWAGRLLAAGLALVAFAVALGAGVYAYFDHDLPSVEALRNYRPPQVTKAFCSDGSLCAEYFRERRTLVPIESLPAHVKSAFVAAEDAEFYKHEGLDYLGMLRAAVKSLRFGSRPTGASTITQQACRNILLSQERTVSRKIREWILTPRMEKALTKDQILNLYLSQINFGHGRYGIEEASLYYFGKHAKDLSLGEAATLGGIPQLPERINPITNIVKAKKRQRYVLAQMAKHGFLPNEVAEREMEKPIVLAPRPPPLVGPYYAEEIRRMVVARYGDEAVLSGGLRLDIAMQPKLQAAADESLRVGLEALDRRMGYRGSLGSVDEARFSVLRPLIARRIAESSRANRRSLRLPKRIARRRIPTAWSRARRRRRPIKRLPIGSPSSRSRKERGLPDGSGRWTTRESGRRSTSSPEARRFSSPASAGPGHAESANGRRHRLECRTW